VYSMSFTIKGQEQIVNPLQESALRKKGLCDYVVNIASGCLHGCTFCYVPATPAIRTKQSELKQKGVQDPQLDWGKYLFVREGIPEKLDQTLSRKKKWKTTQAGRGVVLLCSGTDPYQNAQTGQITREVVSILLKHKKRVRILTRSPLWLNDLDLLTHPNVIVGMSIPYSDDRLSREIEPYSPPPSSRLKALQEGKAAGCRLYVAMAPTPPTLTLNDFRDHLEQVAALDPEVIFWEPINARGTNGKRMIAAGLDWAKSVMTKKSWAESFLQQWEQIELAADLVGCQHLLHIWPDPDLKGYVDQDKLEYWFYRKTVENWNRKAKTTVVQTISESTL